MMQQSVEMAIGRDRVRKALGRYENKLSDKHVSGLVRRVNRDGSYEVLLPGDVQTVKCAAYCNAKAGDVVLVVVRTDRSCAAVGRLGGEQRPVEYGAEDGWRWERHPSGRAICRKRVTLTVTGWNAWGSVYESKESVAPQEFPRGLFSETPSFEAKNAGASDTAAFVMGYATSSNATAGTSPQVHVLRGSALSGSCDFHIDLCAEGVWGDGGEDVGTSALGMAVLGEMVLGKE